MATKSQVSAKLKPIDDELLLTGVACAPEHQHQGHASLLIKTLLSQQTQWIFCFPYAHLEAFYLTQGFSHLALTEEPESIQARYDAYQQHRALLLMVYKQG